MIHAITATWAIKRARKRQALSRRCPECSREQIAEENKLNEPILCENCGAEVPPKSAADKHVKEKKAK